MKRILFGLIIIMSSASNTYANVTCSGKIERLVKWTNEGGANLSIFLEGTSTWIQMNDDIERSMALMAYAANKTVIVSWHTPDVISCSGDDSWAHYKKLEGYIVVED